MDPGIFINEDRIDLVIGIEYIDYYENQYNTDFFIDLYINHKYAFNKLREGKYKGKDGFLNRFNLLINDIKKNKINKEPILIKKDNKNKFWLINGFHRTSIAKYYNFNINVKKCENINISKLFYYPTNIKFFLNKKMDIKYCNYVMLNYLKYYKNQYSCIILFPNKTKLQNEIINKFKNKIIYELVINKKILSEQFCKNFIQLLYYDEKWCKNRGYIKKAEKCFEYINNFSIIFTEKIENNELRNIKNEIRNYYKISNHSVHTPDTKKECNNLLVLLNTNTQLFMNKTKSLYIEFINFNLFLDKLDKFCLKNNIDKKKICITSSAVLSVYGLRDCNDIDLFIDKKYINIFEKSVFDIHNNFSISKHYPKHFEDIIYNPDNYFYFKNFKFCKLEIILIYKKYRVKNKLYDLKSIKKDIIDINLIENMI